MNYCEIKNTDIANGEGIRVSLFVAGCTHHCKGCFNPETWDFSAGKPFDSGIEEKILTLLRADYIDGLTLLGGEPFEPVNQRGLISLIRKVKQTCPEKTIWAFSGYLYDRDLIAGGKAHCEVTDELLDSIDVLVDGPFIESLKNLRLRFRGSENQRLIDLRETRRSGKLTLLQGC